MTDNLAPPGSSSYSSSLMHVGDGTWDATRDDFLLPNLQGLNFATMRYNGMSNRFKGEPQYHTLILGHGVMAAITFIGIMPLAIFLAKYGHDWPGGRVSFKLHVYLQILTVFLSTVVLVLGWFAVGPERSLTNPHHGIGVAVYAMILFQFLYGSCWFRRERKRKTPPVKLPLTVWLHRLLGRATALLAFVEIGLGLTLYGSPKSLFILYALIGFFLLFSYLALDYYYMPRTDGSRPGFGQPEFYSDYGSYVSGSAAPPPRRKESHWGRDLLAAGGMVGAYEWYKNKRDTRRDDRRQKYEERMGQRPPSLGPSLGPSTALPGPPGSHGPPPVGPNQPLPGPPPGPPPMGQPQPGMGPSPLGQQPPMMAGARTGRPGSQSAVSGESFEDEKYSDYYGPPTWRERVLEATGAYAAYDGARNLFSRRRRRNDEYVHDQGYGSTLGDNRNTVSQTDVSRVEAGQVPESPNTPRVNMGGVQPMTPTMTPSRPPRGAAPGAQSSSDEGQTRYNQPPRQGLLDIHAPLSEHVRELGPFAGMREWNRARKARREEDRAEALRRQELENEEQYNQRNSNNYPRPQDASNRRQSTSGTLLTGPSAPDPGQSEMSQVRPDTNVPPLPAEAGTLPSGSHMPQTRQNVTTEQGYSLPPPPPGPPPGGNLRSDGYGPAPEFGSARMPEGNVNPDPSRLLSDNTAANESSAYGRDPPISGSPSRPQDSRNRLQRPSRRGSATSASNGVAAGPSRPDNPNSPPISLKVKMHNDGRHVTLRRLNEEEAAAERETRRQERRRRRNSSLSSGGEEGGPSLGQRYRRNGGVRPSSEQPIANVPAPPPMSSSAGASFRQSQQNLPSAAAPQPPPPLQQVSQQPSPASQGLASPPPVGGVNDSSPGYATDQGTDLSNAFADNRRRRRAERARRQEAAAAQGGGNRVDFQ